jgi:hypothetical protein
MIARVAAIVLLRNVGARLSHGTNDSRMTKGENPSVLDVARARVDHYNQSTLCAC